MWTHNWCGSHTAIHPQAIQHEVIHYLSDQLLERSTTRAIHYLAIHYGEIHYLAIHYLAIHYLAIRYLESDVDHMIQDMIYIKRRYASVL